MIRTSLFISFAYITKIFYFLFKSGDDSVTALAYLPKEARILATGNNLQELQKDSSFFSEVACPNHCNFWTICESYFTN